MSTGEGLTYAVRDEEYGWEYNKKTKENEYVLKDPGVADKRLFIMEEELAAALTCTKREGNTLSVAIRCFWDNGTFAPMTKKERTKCTEAHINIVAHITKAELSKMLDENNTLNGFANRFLWVCSRRSKVVSRPQRMNESELMSIQKELFTRLRAAQAVNVMTMTPAALKLWDKEYPKLSADHPGLAGCIINRGEAQTIRLAMIYALIGGKEHIEEGHLRAGLAFWHYCRASAFYIFGGHEADPVAQKIIEALRSGPMTTTELHKALGNHATKDKLQTSLQALITAGRVVMTEEKTASKPRTIFRLGELCEKCEFSPENDMHEEENSHNSQPSHDEGDPEAAEPKPNKDNSQNSREGEENISDADEGAEMWDGPSEVEI